jgi:hypothetical protein
LHTDSGRDSFNGSYVVEWSDGYLLDVNVFRQETDTVSILEEKNINGLVKVNISKHNIFFRLNMVILVIADQVIVE